MWHGDDGLNAFAPYGARGRQLDRIIHADLAASLAHIDVAISAGPTGWEEVAEALLPLRERLELGARLQPVSFGLYYQLAAAIFAGERARAEETAAMLAGLPEASPGITLLRRGASPPLDDVLDARMGEGAASFAPIDEESAAHFVTLFAEGLDLAKRAVPPLHGELTAILSQVMLAQAPAGAVEEFDGASHFQFWGLVLLNPRHHMTPLAIVEALAHEAGHALLFGLTRDEPLVLNPESELYTSPLRRDPRPMDGIYHATYVSARMAWTMECLAASDLLTPAEREVASAAAAKDRENFAKGLGTVRAHGRLSATGDEILAGAEAAMNG
ncbi:aKG-HExxH-type peptide beta-hydroxylase [Pseudoroseicyclus sp. H15]